MKRFTTFFLILSLFFTLTSCNENENNIITSETEITLETTTEKEIITQIETLLDIDPFAAEIISEPVKPQYSLEYMGSQYYPAHSPNISFLGELLYYHEADIDYIPPEPIISEIHGDPYYPPYIPPNIEYSVFAIKDISSEIAVIVKFSDDYYLTYTNLIPPKGSIVTIIKNWDSNNIGIINIEQLKEEDKINPPPEKMYIIELLSKIDVENSFNYSNNPYGNLGEEVLFVAFCSEDTGINFIVYVYDRGFMDISLGFYADSIIAPVVL